MNNDKEYDVVIIKDEHDSSQNYSNNDKYRSLNEAINYDYDFSISDILSKAWGMVDGSKLPVFITTFLVSILATTVAYLGQYIASLVSNITILSTAIEMIFNGISSIFIIAVIIVVLKLANREKINTASIFNLFSQYWLPMLVISIVMSILITIGVILLIIPGIYLAVAYSLVYWILVIHPKESFWNILEASRKIVTRHWFKFFIINLIFFLIPTIIALIIWLILSLFGFSMMALLYVPSTFMIISIALIVIIPFIASLWILPFYSLSYALIFKKIFEK